jgi:hypothetical protein
MAMKPCAIPPRPDLDPRRWRAGRKRGEQQAAVTTIRRIVIEDFLFPPKGLNDPEGMPRSKRAKPQGRLAVEWLVLFFERLEPAAPRSRYPLKGASESTIRRDITAILKERATQGKNDIITSYFCSSLAG